MKANELMIGDWVQGFVPDTYSQIEQTTWNGRVVIFTRNGQEIELNEEDVQPIPLTAEILEKNGWKRNGDYPEYNLPINGVVGWSMDTHMIRIRNNTDFETNDIFVRCDYVHELQHALRLCGLTELADNFKV